MASAIRRQAVTEPGEFDPRKFWGPAMTAMEDLCRLRFEQFGAAGRASSITVVPLDEMAGRYRSGALDPLAPTSDIR
jgi:fructose-bisphosphate aldolase class II